MDIHIEWQEPIQLTHNKNIIIADDALQGCSVLNIWR